MKVKIRSKKSVSKIKSLEWDNAYDVKRDIKKILRVLNMPHVNSNRIFCYRTNGSKSRSYARIWSFPKIFQDALEIEPAYVIEVLAKHYDKLSADDKTKVLIHELLHIPKNFSGALVPHKTRNRHLVKTANVLFNEYKKSVIN